jgi:hypothetical protein
MKVAMAVGLIASDPQHFRSLAAEVLDVLGRNQRSGYSPTICHNHMEQ